MDSSGSSDTTPSLIDLNQQAILQVALLGAGLGLFSWVVTMLVRQIIFVPLFCGDPANGACVEATGGAGVVALIITAIVGLLGLVRLAIYRPLLVSLATAISLWSLGSWISGMFWLEAIAWSVILYALSYVLFTWLVRPRSFVLAVGLTVAVVLLARIFAVV